MNSRFFSLNISLLLCFTAFLPLLFMGCANLGSKTLKSERSNYNLAIQRTNDEQLLLNLVRLKYRDTPFFMEVSSVASQFTLSTTANASATLQDGVRGLLGIRRKPGNDRKANRNLFPITGRSVHTTRVNSPSLANRRSSISFRLEH